MALGNIRQRSKKFVTPKLMITSMMDMFTIILIFLLFQFSEKPETIHMLEDIELPRSTAKMEHNENVRLVLTAKGLHLDDELIARVQKDRVVGIDPDNLEDSVLFNRLQAQFIEASLEDDQTMSKNHILFLCDKRHSFKTINSIIKTAALAGYPNFQFAVLKE
ncbi:MAG: biopolymer transporter ExbD [Deltaproteobacteria bacterium]|nr:biopolymer transporter ExbD [Deltaproteobacteria bacterium]